MRVLIVTGMSIPLRDILTGKTENEITGLPGFFYPWYKLVKKGHEVDFVIISNFNEEFDIKVDWFKKENIIANIYAPYSEKKTLRIIRQVKRLIQLIYHTYIATNKKEYDFIYCKVYEGVAGQIVAKLKGIPYGNRLFGDFTFCYPDIVKYGKFKSILKHPLEYLSFKLGGNFLLATDDGTNCDKLYEHWKNKSNSTQFLHWKSGVDLSEYDNSMIDTKLPTHDYVIYVARFSSWKRHDLVVKTLNEIHSKGLKYHLYFAGSKTSITYYDEVMELAKQLGLENYVHYLGKVDSKNLKSWIYNAKANFFMYDFSNLGNVFYETLSVGGIIISINDGSLSGFIKNNENGFLIENVNDAAEKVYELSRNLDLQSVIRINARKTALQKIMSIDERFNKEVELIESFGKIADKVNS